MKFLSSFVLMLAFVFASPAFATVVVNAPQNGSTVGQSVAFNASGNTTCSSGVATMGIYVDDTLSYVANGATLNTTLPLSPGNHHIAVQEWDFCGGATNAPLNLSVTSGQGGITVMSPANYSTVPAVAPFAASATTTCPAGVAAMGVYINGNLVTVQQGSSLNANVPLPAGTTQTVVQSWDRCGASAKAPVTVTVAASGGNKLSNLQAVSGWNQWGQLPPVYGICDAPCQGVTWGMTQHVSAGSLSGNATKYYLGGTTPYSDALFSIKLIGQGSIMGMPDYNHSVLPGVHHMTYDTDVYVGDMSVTQDLEFDANMYMNGVGMEWGTECNHLGGGVWDIWDNVNAHWMHTSIPCNLNSNSWNHVTLTFQREANNDLTYQTITVNGKTYSVNRTVPPFQVPGGWYGMTANFQPDGNYRQAAYMTMLDNLSVTYY